MSVNSIEYNTKKHFRSPLSLIVTLVSIAVAALSVRLAMKSGYSPVAVSFAAFASVSAFFTLLRIFSVNIGCKLMRFSVAVTAVVLFFSAMSIFTLGYLLLRNNEIQEQLNAFFADFGFTLATAPAVTGTLFFAGSVLLYFASACAFFCHRYLGAVRKCAQGSMKRSGLRVFPVLSAILSLLTVGSAAVLFCNSRIIVPLVTSDPVRMMTAGLGGLLLLHLILAGLCARSFARKTYAFKVFEHQIMKVETNADGTVYVPIDEDVEPDAEEPLLPTNPRKKDADTQKGKPFISEFSAVSTTENTGTDLTLSEGNIL